MTRPINVHKRRAALVILSRFLRQREAARRQIQPDGDGNTVTDPTTGDGCREHKFRATGKCVQGALDSLGVFDLLKAAGIVGSKTTTGSCGKAGPTGHITSNRVLGNDTGSFCRRRDDGLNTALDVDIAQRTTNPSTIGVSTITR
jgi:hypothetical protein